MEKCKNRKMHILIGHGKNVKITKYISQLGIEKNAKIPKCLKMRKKMKIVEVVEKVEKVENS